jgi:hypothetical protein
MKSVHVVREQAATLRALTESFESPQIKEELLFLAERCDRLAVLMTDEIFDRRSRPISGKPRPG